MPGFRAGAGEEQASDEEITAPDQSTGKADREGCRWRSQ